MDIDEFLDRELADLGLAEKSEKDSQVQKDSDSAISASIKADLNKGTLEEAEQSYTQLWALLAQQKLKWDKELYEQLHFLSRQLSSSMAQAYDEMKRKADHIYGLISRARNALKEGKKDAPMKLYAEMQELSNSIPNVFFEEKKAVQEQIIIFYRDLVSTIDSELSKRVAKLVAQISQSISSIGNSIKLGNVEEASANYIKCAELFTQIPEGFLKTKNSLGIQLLDIYRTLSIYTEIFDLQKQLGSVQAGLPKIPPRAYPRAYSKPAEAADSRRQAQSYYAKQADKNKNAQMPANEILLSRKREHAKKNIRKGFYNEAWKDVEEALQIEPNDVESKALRAKIKTLQ